MKATITYDQAIQELEQIVSNLEDKNVINMDEYAKQAKRAAELIDFCTKKLRTIDTELQNLFEEE